MPEARRQGPLRGLGAKYGATVRKRYTRIVQLRRLRRECPSCGAPRLRRKAAGIWSCQTCGHTVAGGAYDITT